jgi:hypothetical protein
VIYIAYLSGSSGVAPSPRVLLFTAEGDTVGGGYPVTDKSEYERIHSDSGGDFLTAATAQFKYGSQSVLGELSGRTLFYADEPDLRFGTGDFTVQAWVYPTSSATAGIVGKRNNEAASDNSWVLFTNFTGGNVSMVEIDSGGIVASHDLGAALPLNTWSHVAYAKESGVLRGFIDGEKLLEVATSHNYGDNDEILIVGGNTSLNSLFAGYFDDLCLTKGVAEYTGDFTPPTSQLTPSYP